MNREASIVNKTESAIDDLIDLWRRRKLICLLVLLVITIPTGFMLYQKFIAIPRLQTDVSTKNAQIDDLKRQRDTLDIKLTSFQAAADKAFPDKKKEDRLDLLLDSLDRIAQDIQHVLPYQLSDEQREVLRAEINAVVDEERRRAQGEPSLLFLTFPGQSADAVEFMSFLQTALHQAGRKTDALTNFGGVGGVNERGEPWSGVIISVDDKSNAPFIATALRDLLKRHGLQVYSVADGGFGFKVAVTAHRLGQSAGSETSKTDPR